MPRILKLPFNGSFDGTFAGGALLAGCFRRGELGHHLLGQGCQSGLRGLEDIGYIDAFPYGLDLHVDLDETLAFHALIHEIFVGFQLRNRG